MGDIAIKVEGLGKQYRLGVTREKYYNLRDAIVNTVKAPFRKFARLSGKAGPENEMFWALKDVSFEVKHGEVLGIIGRNGAGKSTLLKILSRITEPTEGSVKLYGRVGSLLEVGTGFHPELTGRENIYLSGAILGMRKLEINRKFDEIVDFSGIEKFLDTPVKRYSSGMYVRLAFAVAAHLEPEILVVDEVLAVGDAEFQKKCLGKMGEVVSGGRTILFVSHNMAAVNRLCSRSMLLENGQNKSVGPTSEIVGKYLSRCSTRSSVVFFQRRPGAKIQYKSVSVCNSQGQVSNAILNNEEFTAKLDIQVYEPISNAYFGLILKNSQGVDVVFSDSRDVEGAAPHQLLEGQYTVSLRFPSIFAPGTYFVSVGIAERLSLQELDIRDSCYSFEVIKNSNIQRTHKRPGVIELKLPWEFEVSNFE